MRANSAPSCVCFACGRALVSARDSLHSKILRRCRSTSLIKRESARVRMRARVRASKRCTHRAHKRARALVIARHRCRHRCRRRRRRCRQSLLFSRTQTLDMLMGVQQAAACLLNCSRLFCLHQPVCLQFDARAPLVPDGCRSSFADHVASEASTPQCIARRTCTSRTDNAESVAASAHLRRRQSRGEPTAAAATTIERRSFARRRLRAPMRADEKAPAYRR